MARYGSFITFSRFRVWFRLGFYLQRQKKKKHFNYFDHHFFPFTPFSIWILLNLLYAFTFYSFLVFYTFFRFFIRFFIIIIFILSVLVRLSNAEFIAKISVIKSKVPTAKHSAVDPFQHTIGKVLHIFVSTPWFDFPSFRISQSNFHFHWLIWGLLNIHAALSAGSNNRAVWGLHTGHALWGGRFLFTLILFFHKDI